MDNVEKSIIASVYRHHKLLVRRYFISTARTQCSCWTLCFNSGFSWPFLPATVPFVSNGRRCCKRALKLCRRSYATYTFCYHHRTCMEKMQVTFLEIGTSNCIGCIVGKHTSIVTNLLKALLRFSKHVQHTHHATIQWKCFLWSPF
jgi:hypothetical protein